MKIQISEFKTSGVGGNLVVRVGVEYGVVQSSGVRLDQVGLGGAMWDQVG